MISKAILSLVSFGKKLLLAERTPKKLAYASSIGIFIAFSPFVGFHWLITLILAWLLRLNIGVMYAASHVVNNPFTMIPIYWAGYVVGSTVTEYLQLNLLPYNPSWMNWLNVKLSCLGIPHLSLWDFLIGGNILGLLCAAIAYPFLIHFYKRLLRPTV